MRFRRDIEGLRGVAVLAVVLGHLGFTAFAGGFVGVDVFFVISGFLITGLLLNEYDKVERVSLAQFYLRRVKRLLPASLVVIVAVVIAAGALLSSSRAADVRSDALWATFFGANINFIRKGTDYFNQALAASPLQHYWSLSVEEQFYLVWPALFLLLSHLARRRDREDAHLHEDIEERPVSRALTSLPVAIGLVTVGSFAYAVYATGTSKVAAYFSTFTRVWELGLGCLLAVGARRLGRRELPSAVRTGLGAAGILALVASMCVLIDESTAFPGWIALVPTLATVAMLVAGLPGRETVPTKVLSFAPLRFLGQISYSLYLWHWPVIIFNEALYPESVGTPFNRALVTAVAVAISVVSYYVIEQPIRHWKLGYRTPTRAEHEHGLVRVPLAFLAVVALAGTGVLVATRTSDGGTSDAAVDEPEIVATTVAASVPSTSATVSSVAGAATSSTAATAVATPATTAEMSAARTAPAATIAGADLSAWSKELAAAVTMKEPSDALRSEIDKIAGTEVPLCADPTVVVRCVIGPDSAPRLVAVVGDSHAAAVAEAVAADFPAPDYQTRVYWKPGCTVGHLSKASPVQQNLGNGDYAKCNERRDLWIQDILQRKPEVIVLSDDASWKSSNFEDWTNGLRETIDRLAPLGPTTRIYLLSQVPGAKRLDVCLTKTTDLTNCARKAKETDKARAAQQAAITGTDVTYVDMTAWLCSDGVCPAVIGDSIVYQDGNHFTVDFRVEHLAPLLATVLRRP